MPKSLLINLMCLLLFFIYNCRENNLPNTNNITDSILLNHLIFSSDSLDVLPKLIGYEKYDLKESIIKYTNENIKYPKNEINCLGDVKISCIIDTCGKIYGQEIISGLDACEGYNEEALRLLKTMNWISGLKNEKKVSTKIVISIDFSINRLH